VTLSVAIRGDLTVATRSASARASSRNFAAAQPSRLVSSWSTSLLTSDEILERDLRSLVARSREQRRNNDYVKGFDSLARVNVIGRAGVVVRPKPLTAKGELDSQAKRAVADAWEDWSRASNCDLESRNSWVDIQNLLISSNVQSGEFLARKIVGVEGGSYGYRLQLFDPQSLDPTFRRDGLPGGNFVRLSIEFDAFGRAVAYWVRTLQPARELTLPTFAFGGATLVRVPAAQMHHVFLPEEIGQKRGVPWIATSLLRLRMLDAYQEAALVAARAGAQKVAWITRKRGRGYTGPQDADGYRTMNAEPGTIEELDEGSTLLNYDPTYPHGEYDSFIKRTLQGIATGCLVSYTTLANDSEGSSFSAERSRKLSERDVWTMLQAWAVTRFHQPVFEEWLAFALAAGKIRSGGRVYSPTDFDRLRRVSYQPRTFPWATNPLQEATAAKLEVDSGFRSRDDVIVSNYGKDPADVDDEIAAAQKRAGDKGLALSGPSEIALTVTTEGTPQNG
jgi:lambda family phage portal protein